MFRKTVLYIWLGLFLAGGAHAQNAAPIIDYLNGLPTEALSAVELNSLAHMREEEKLARDVYQTLSETWSVPIFSNIAGSEQFHFDLIGVIYEKYDLEDNTAADPGVFNDPNLQDLYNSLVETGNQSFVQALTVGATIEDLDIFDLNELLANDAVDNEDVRTVYQNLVRGSRNHMRAFYRQLQWQEVTYAAQYISAAELEAIVTGAHEAGAVDADGNPLDLGCPPGGPQGDSGWNPEEIELSGTVLVDTLYYHPYYYLDVNEDDQADFHLNFGPFWYAPDSDTNRPQPGDVVVIVGGLVDHADENMLDMVIVWELNGEFWRDPYEPGGGHYAGGGHHGQHGTENGHHGGGWHGGGGSWVNLTEISLTGVVIIDPVNVQRHYYLDVNADNIPDYRLNFGPHWYTPESGAARPLAGEEISLVGGHVTGDDSDCLTLVIVWELNGQVWLDPGALGWGGQHIHHQGGNVSCPTDQNDWVEFPDGALHGHTWNHLYVEFHESPSWEIPDPAPTMFGGYHVVALGMNGVSLMDDHGQLQFSEPVTLHLHYTDEQLGQINRDAEEIALYFWDISQAAWVPITDVEVNSAANTVIASSEIIHAEYALAVTLIPLPNENPQTDSFADLRLYQNYPNPFNPTTQISYQINSTSHVNLSIFDISGRLVQTLVNQPETTGRYTVTWDAGSNSTATAASGLYFYVLQIAGEEPITRTMTLLK